MLFSSTFGLDRIPISLAARFKKFLPALAYLGAAALIVALARPQFGIRESRVVGNGISIVMCVDRSGSMAAEDFEINGRPVTRLEAVKKVFRDFVEGSKDSWSNQRSHRTHRFWRIRRFMLSADARSCVPYRTARYDRHANSAL